MARKRRRPASAARKPGRNPAQAESVRAVAAAPAVARPGRPGEALRAAWRRIPRSFLRRFLVSLAIALCLEAAIGWLHHHHPRFQELEDRALDWTVGVSRGLLPSRPDPVGYSFLDIDEPTYREWGEPTEIPREKLALLIDRTLAACPRLLIVDVDLTKPSDRQGDAALVRVLRTQATNPLPAECARRPPILFPVALRGPEVRGKGEDGDDARWERRASFLEPALAGIPNVAWASPLFERASDWQIRRWRLWERICPEREGRPEVVPSVQLLAAGGLQLSTLSAVLEEVRRKVGPTLAWCSGHRAATSCESHGEEEGAKLEFGAFELSVCPSQLNERIVYRYPMPGELREKEGYPLWRGRQLLNVVPAAPLARDSVPFDPSVFEDRVVVIGGSFEEGRDIHRTPLGPMPGALILINAIDSLLEHGEIEPLGRPARYGVLMLSVLALSIIFTAFPPLKSALLSLALVVFVLLPASLLLFRDGYWLDFAIPVVGVFLHKWVADVEGLFHKSHQEQRG